VSTLAPRELAREAWVGYFPDAGSIGASDDRQTAACFASATPARVSADHQRPPSRAGRHSQRPARISPSPRLSSDCRRDLPSSSDWPERRARARIFNRDGKKILGTRRPDPATYPDAITISCSSHEQEEGGVGLVPVVAIYSKDFTELHRYFEFGHLPQGPRAGPNAGGRPARASPGQGARPREFRALQASPSRPLGLAASRDLSALTRST